MSSVLTRSTNAISEFIRANRRAVAAAIELKQAQAQMQTLRDDVLQQIGDSRTVKVDGTVSTLTPRKIESIKRTCDDATAVEFFRSHGLPVNTRTPEYIAPAAFTAKVKAGAVSQELYSVETTIDVNVI